MQDNTITETEKLQAENKNLKQLLEEYQQAALLKNMEQRELEEKAASGAEAKSYYDLQTEELKYVRNYINELMQKAEAAAQREADLEKQVTQSISTAHQLEDVKIKYNYLQVQLDDLAERLQQLNSQNILQSQYASRIAELESMLANAEEEIELLKNPSEAES
ncbi:MAG: hypothetical protein V4685_15205 [Bacteroidota bacterium]